VSVYTYERRWSVTSAPAVDTVVVTVTRRDENGYSSMVVEHRLDFKKGAEGQEAVQALREALAALDSVL